MVHCRSHHHLVEEWGWDDDPHTRQRPQDLRFDALAVARRHGVTNLQIDAITIACRRHRVARLHVFESVLRPDFRSGECAIDLLVEVQPDEPGALCRTSFSLLTREDLDLRDRLVWGCHPG